jgi:hypothetical protein
MRERAQAEGRRLGAERFTLDKQLVLALLASAKGNRAREAEARVMLEAQEQAAVERERREGPTRADLVRVQADLRRVAAGQPMNPGAPGSDLSQHL